MVRASPHMRWYRPSRLLAFTRYCYYQYCMVYRIQTGGRKVSRILSNNRATVLHQGRQCRWAGGMNGWLIRAQQFRINEYLVNANSPVTYVINNGISHTHITHMNANTNKNNPKNTERGDTINNNNTR